MTKKEKKNLMLMGILYVGSIALYFWFVNTDFFPSFKAWSQQNVFITITVLIFVKILGIVWPPLPGGLLTLGAIPILGWPLAYACDFVGSIIGSSIDFYIGKKYGDKFIRKIFDETTFARIHTIKVKKDKEIEATFALRLIGGNTIVEAISYAAGHLGIKYSNFLIGTVLSHTVLGIPTYFLADNIFSTNNLGFRMALTIIALTILWKAKGRYFE